ncbi:MAG: hypothetical protein IJ629_01270 [Clostridia bacterium]|nr:hypothetical protein [Clostridia bacterium]
MKIISKITSGVVIASLLTYYASPVLAYVNEETIYSNLDSNGKKYSSSVTTIIEDKNGTTTKQDETEKELPIETKIAYYLNGEEMNSSKIAGKSGRVTIKIEFENKDKHGDIYTPFVVVSGLMIDNKANTNIEIVNGKLLTNGNYTIAVGVALPGMQESLGIAKENIEIPNSVEISMDTDKFESGNIMVYASPKLLGELNISMNDFDEIFNQVNALETAAKALENGASTLNEGIKALDVGTVQLDNGITALDLGIDTLKAGTNDLNNGAISLKNGTAEFAASSQLFNSGVTQVSDGVNSLKTQYAELDSGINTLNNKSNELKAGANQLKDGAVGLDAGASQVLAGINNAVEGLEPSMTEEAKNAKKTALDEIIAYNEEALGENSTATIQGLQAQIVTYEENLNEIPSSEELQAGLAAGLLTSEQVTNYETTRKLLQGLIQSLTSNVQLLTLTQGNYTALTQTKDSISQSVDDLVVLYNGLLAIQGGMEQVSEGATSLSGGLTTLSSGTDALTEGTASLADGSNKVVEGLGTLNSGASSLAESSEKLTSASTVISNGASDLQNGTASLQAGVDTLSNGSKQLKDGSIKLTEGTLQLVSGSQTLADGMKQFNQDGISKIADLVNKDGKDFVRKVEKLEKLSNDYTSFASKEERDDLKFISITDSIKVETKASDTKSDKNSKSKK